MNVIAARAAITGNVLPHTAAEVTKAVTPEATEAVTAATRCIAGTPRADRATIAIAEELPERKAPLWA